MIRHEERLIGVNQKLTNVVVKAATHLPYDVCVVEGVRTPERQRQLYAQGRTVPGKIVTWTLNSKHIKAADGTGHAVDLCAQIAGKLDWTKADEIGRAMNQASKELAVPIRWGADWNQNGRPHEKGETDSPHFELA
jgi:peptidoglycan L-alanyl-D-glutamate endopeptidase CwlK